MAEKQSETRAERTLAEVGRLAAEGGNADEFNRTFALAAERRQLLDALVRRRRKQGWSQERLAKELHTSQPTISAIEHGRKDSRLWTLMRMADALGCRINLELTERSAEGGDEPSAGPSFYDTKPPSGTYTVTEPARGYVTGAET